MFNHEFSNRNYILTSQLSIFNEQNYINKLSDSNFKTNLEIDDTSKTIRINLYDVFTIYAMLNEKPNKNDLNQILKLHSLFVRNYIDQDKLNLDDEYLLLDYYEMLGGINEIFGTHKIKGGDDKIINKELTSLEQVVEKILNELKLFNDNSKKTYEYIILISDELKNIIQNPENYNKKIYDDLIETIKKYNGNINAIFKNCNKIKKHDLNDLNNKLIESEITEVINDIDNTIKKIDNDKKILDDLVEKQIIFDEEIENDVAEFIKSKNSIENEEIESEVTGNEIFWIILFLIIIVIIICVISGVCLCNKPKPTIIHNNPTPKKEEIKPFNLMNTETESRLDIAISNNVESEIDNLKVDLKRNVNDVLKRDYIISIDNLNHISDKNSNLINKDYEPDLNVINREIELEIKNNINKEGNNILHKIEMNQIHSNQDDMFGNLEVL